MPIIDVGPLLAGETGALAKLLCNSRIACSDRSDLLHRQSRPGSGKLVDRSFDASRELFGLPQDAKLRVRMNQHQCGFQPSKVAIQRTGLGDARRQTQRQRGVQIHARSAFVGSRLPRPQTVRRPQPMAGRVVRPIARRATGRIPDVRCVGKSLLPMVATALGQAPDYFDPFFATSSSVVRLAWYPRCPSTRTSSAAARTPTCRFYAPSSGDRARLADPIEGRHLD